MAGARLMDVERVLFAVGEGADCRGTAVRDARVCTLSEAGFAGFFGIFRMAGVPPALVCLYERWTRVCERLREITSVCECLRVLGGLSEAGFAGFFGIFRMAGVPPALVLVRALDESLRAFTRDSDRSSEGTGRAAGDFSVVLPAKAGQRGYFSEFFHKNVRFVRSKAYFEFDFGLFQVSSRCC